MDSKTFDQMMKIIGFRNVLVHDYLNVELKLVTEVVQKKSYQFLEDLVDGLLEKLEKEKNNF